MKWLLLIESDRRWSAVIFFFSFCLQKLQTADHSQSWNQKMLGERVQHSLLHSGWGSGLHKLNLTRNRGMSAGCLLLQVPNARYQFFSSTSADLN